MNQQSFLSSDQNSSQSSLEYKLFVDGASRGNPGPAGIGMLCTAGDKTIFEHGFAIGTQTNNFAEYAALICGLFLLAKHLDGKRARLEIVSDSQLLVFQLNGLYKVKHPTIKTLMAKAQSLVTKFDWKATHVLRDNNKLADKLANKGLDDKVALPDELKALLG